jgi:hypothetical protein
MSTNVKSYLVYAGIVLVLIGGAFAAGRYSKPAKVTETIKVVTEIRYEDRIVEKIVTKTVAGPTHTVIVHDGKTDSTTTTIDTGPVVTDSQSDSTQDTTGTSVATSESKKVTDNRPRFALGVSWNLWPQPIKPIPVAEGSVRVIGPIWGTVAAGPGSSSGLQVRAGMRVEF